VQRSSSDHPLFKVIRRCIAGQRKKDRKKERQKERKKERKKEKSNGKYEYPPQIFSISEVALLSILDLVANPQTMPSSTLPFWPKPMPDFHVSNSRMRLPSLCLSSILSMIHTSTHQPIHLISPAPLIIIVVPFDCSIEPSVCSPYPTRACKLLHYHRNLIVSDCPHAERFVTTTHILQPPNHKIPHEISP
jgi:hypothetical protein